MDTPAYTSATLNSSSQKCSLGLKPLATTVLPSTSGRAHGCGPKAAVRSAQAGLVLSRRNRRLKHFASLARATDRGSGGINNGDVDDSPEAVKTWGRREGIAAPRSRRFRFWIDYQAFGSPGSATLIERALLAVGGVRAGGPAKRDAATAGTRSGDGVYGYMHMESWDLLWSVTAKAALAADLLRPHQMLAIVPGLLAISRKTTLVRSLRDMFGAAAWGIIPRSYKLPDELDEWGAWVAANPQHDTGLWMLKNNKQRGTGLRLVRTSEAFTACFETVSRPDLPSGMRLYRWYLAQQYVAAPLLIDGRKFGVRLWVLVSDVAPLRLYIHSRGLILFSSHRYDSEQVSAEGADEEGAPAPGHVTNYAQNENGDVWSLVQLGEHLGRAVFSKLWTAMCRAAAAAFAAAMPRCAEVMASVRPPPHACFQFFGLDFLLDANVRPWLLEVNATPSMKVEHTDPRVAALIHGEKWPVVRDMVALLGLGPERFHEPGGRTPDRATPGYALEELRRRGGFIPLLHLLPNPATSSTAEAAAAAGLLRPLSWSRADRALRDWCRTCREYHLAAVEVPGMVSEGSVAAAQR